MTTPVHTRDARALFLNPDGTITQGGDYVPERTRHAIAAARERGIRVALATDRPLHDVLPIAKQLGMAADDYAIVSNGAITIRFTGRHIKPYRIESRDVFSPEDAFIMAKQENRTVFLGVEMPSPRTGHPGGWRVNVRFPPGHLVGKQYVVPEETLWENGRQVTRAVICAPGIADIVPWIVDAGLGTAYATGTDRIDVISPGRSKLVEAAWLCHEWGIDLGHVAAAGASMADIPLLTDVGHACTPHGAPSAVQNAGNWTCGPVEDEGIVPWLDSLYPPASETQDATETVDARTAL